MNAAESLGNVIKDTRIRLGLTQAQVAEKVGVEVRTIMHIENCAGNPTWEVVFPLIRELDIDPRVIFYPETNREDEGYTQMQILLSQCDEEDILSLMPICEAALSVFRSRNGIPIKE